MWGLTSLALAAGAIIGLVYNDKDTLMNTDEITRYIERVPLPGEAQGYPRIAGRRVSVVDIVTWRRDGRTVADISVDYDLDESAVQAALAFYEANRKEIDRYIAEGEAFFETGYEAQLRDPIYLGMKARREALVLRERPDLDLGDSQL